jgi:drug/metabolite transporter (DMT)-like permease
MGVAGLLLVSTIWGASFLTIKLAAGGFGPLGIAAGRLAVASACLLVATAVIGGRLPRDRAAWSRLLALCGVGQMGPFLLLGVSGHLTASGNIALMQAAAPLLAYLFGRWFAVGDPWAARTWAGLVLGLAGVLLALGPPAAAGPADWLGRLAALGAAAGYALAALISRDLQGRVDLLTTVTATMTVSALVMGGVWLGLQLAGAGPGWPQPTAGQATALGILGAVNTAFNFLVYFWLIRREGATFAALNNYLVPVIGVLLGALVLGEPLRPGALTGLALILAGMALVRRPPPGSTRVAARAATD